jgi:hypothetical protein
MSRRAFGRKGWKGPARLRMSRPMKPRKPKIRRRWRPGGGYL